jgi:hypothetical protein
MQLRLIFTNFIFGIVMLSAFAVSAAPISGIVRQSESELRNSPPTSVSTYTRDCDATNKPSGMASTIVTAGNTVTITETDGVNTWVSTVVTNGGTVTVSCAQKQ